MHVKRGRGRPKGRALPSAGSVSGGDAAPLQSRIHSPAQAHPRRANGFGLSGLRQSIEEARRVVAYIRISSIEQRLGVSLRAQYDEIRYYCESLKVPAPIPADERVFRLIFEREPQPHEVALDQANAPGLLFGEVASGTEKATHLRVELKRALQHVARGTLFIGSKIDRVARSTRVGLEILRHLQERGATIVTIAEKIDTSTPEGEATFTQWLSFAQVESSRIADRTSTGRQFLRREGCHTEGPVPLGFERTKRGRRSGPLKPKDPERAIVAELFEGYDNGGSGGSLFRMCQEKYKGVRRWTPSYILKILKDRRYIGDMQNASGGEWIAAHEPIVSKELFYRVQEKIRAADLKKEGRPAAGKRYDAWLLHGLMECAQCGSSVMSVPYPRAFGHPRTPSLRTTKHEGYYACSRYCPSKIKDDKPLCEGWHLLKNDAIDEAAERQIVERLEHLEDIWTDPEMSAVERPYRDFDAERKALKEKLDHIADGYANRVLNAAQARRLREETERDLEKLNAEEARHLAEREAIDHESAQRALLDAAPKLRELWPYVTPLEKRELTGLLTAAIVLSPKGDLTFRWRDATQIIKRLGFISGGGLLQKVNIGSGCNTIVLPRRIRAAPRSAPASRRTRSSKPRPASGDRAPGSPARASRSGRPGSPRGDWRPWPRRRGRARGALRRSRPGAH